MTLAQQIVTGSGILITILILIQTKGSDLGAGMGSGGEIETVRRGSDLTIFRATIVLIIVFVAAILSMLVKL